jgi:hypothetical protein
MAQFVSLRRRFFRLCDTLSTNVGFWRLSGMDMHKRKNESVKTEIEAV